MSEHDTPPENPPADAPPAPPENPPADPPPPSPPSPGDGDRMDRVESIVESMAQTVASLTDTVTKLAKPDENTVKVPWTHRGFGSKK